MATRKIKTPGDTSQDDTQNQGEQVPQDPNEATLGMPKTLPRAADIDPHTISRSVLTQDGWVCPA